MNWIYEFMLLIGVLALILQVPLLLLRDNYTNVFAQKWHSILTITGGVCFLLTFGIVNLWNWYQGSSSIGSMPSVLLILLGIFQVFIGINNQLEEKLNEKSKLRWFLVLCSLFLAWSVYDLIVYYQQNNNIVSWSSLILMLTFLYILVTRSRHLYRSSN